ncbi:hypothetical protein O3P69_006437 [Scylla paramamosain]|uniref:Uncharacterized protein n=1 Tax=Scylla paramamosain TaxID=85552 RepID=A0AAW0U3A9_SCYPA
MDKNAGYLLDWDAYQLSHDFVRSITEFSMPPPLSPTDVRSWFGLVNQSNGRAEVGVKSAKRLLRGNLTRGGSLDTDGVTRALLQFLNTPLQGCEASTAQLLTGRQLRDAIAWFRRLRDRERVMTCTTTSALLRHDKQAHLLAPLAPGQRVRIQNPTSVHLDRLGIVTHEGVEQQGSPGPTPQARAASPNPTRFRRASRHLSEYWMDSLV